MGLFGAPFFRGHMRLLDYDPLTGIKTYWGKDKQTGLTTIKEEQDFQPIVDRNTLMSAGLNKKDNMWYVGTIPNVLCQQFAKECGHKVFSKEWNEYAIKQLNHSDYRKFNQNKIKI